MRGWIKWDKGLAKKPEIYRIAKIMGISRREAATACMEAWEWADDTMDVDGRVDATVDAIDDAAGLPGLAKAMQEVGWLAEGDTVYMPGYAEHNGPTGRTRDLKNARQARWRDGKASTERLHGRLPSASQNRLPDEEEEKKKNIATEQQGAGAPAAGAADLFRDTTEMVPKTTTPAAEPPKPKRQASARFTPPTMEEAIAYAAEISMAPARASQFMDYQTAKGWKVGTAPMKCWKAAMRTWNARPDFNAPSTNGGQALNPKRTGSLPYLQIATNAEWVASMADEPVYQKDLDDHLAMDELTKEMAPESWEKMKDRRATEYQEKVQKMKDREAREGKQP